MVSLLVAEQRLCGGGGAPAVIQVGGGVVVHERKRI